MIWIKVTFPSASELHIQVAHGVSMMASSERSRSGVLLKPYYTASDLPSQDANDFPGALPFTRGRFARMKDGKGWIQREPSGEGSPAHSKSQVR